MKQEADLMCFYIIILELTTWKLGFVSIDFQQNMDMGKILIFKHKFHWALIPFAIISMLPVSCVKFMWKKQILFFKFYLICGLVEYLLFLNVWDNRN